MTGYPTNFMETNALLAVQSGDPAEALGILNDMLPGELRELVDACHGLIGLCEAVLESGGRR